MKTISTNVIVAITAFTTGYLLYPQLNSNTSTELNTKVPPKAQSSNTQPEALANHSLDETQVNKTAATNDESQQELEDESLILNPDNNASVENQLDKKVTNMPSSIEQEQLKEWSVEYQENIESILLSYMTEGAAMHMKEEIITNNEIFDTPSINQDPTDDETWAFNTEQQLRQLLEQHELSNDFDVFNVSCKQLNCDILGVDKTRNSWFPIYFSLLGSFSNAIFPDDNNPAKSIQYLEGDAMFVYSQIKFSG